MNINGAFRFHNVGQGLFYSGLLSKKENRAHNVFSFVYDCGTDSAASFLQREIDDFKLLLPATGITRHKRLNLLVISHLHDDHVNGLEYLLKDIEVDTVVMPYTNDGLKLSARLESHNDDEFLQVFYTDPVAWFASKGVHRILLIGSEEIAEGQNDSLDTQYQYIENADIDVEQRSILKIDYFDKTEIAYLKNKTQISSRNFWWKFNFENLRLKSGKVNSYIQIVENFKQEKCLTLEQIFESKLLLDDLRKQVKAAFPNGSALNRTSVVLLHGPIRMPNMVDLCNKCSWKYSDNYIVKLHLLDSNDFPYSGTILTGDIELEKNECLEILDYYSDKSRRYCLLLQYPHHGSRNNNIQYFIDLGAKVNVLSYGIINRHGHPHDIVLQQLSNIVFVNERESWDYQIMLQDFGDAKT